MEHAQGLCDPKLKILYLADYFRTETDEAHPVTTEQIIAALARRGIRAERKTVYADIDALVRYGMDIQKKRTKTTAYYLATREFELPELKLLVDSVQSSRFITEKKSAELVKKLEAFCSRHDAVSMRREVIASGRVKSMNETIYYNVDRIHAAIAENRSITFRYFRLYPAYGGRLNREKVYGHEDHRYTVSPFAMLVDSEYYYLIAYDHDSGEIRNYRVDRMEDIHKTRAERQGTEAYAAIDKETYRRGTFRMYSGEVKNVTMEFDNALFHTVSDRFGKDVSITRVDEDHFRIHETVSVSPQFYGWVFGLGNRARITAPEDVVNGMRDMLVDVFKQY